MNMHHKHSESDYRRGSIIGGLILVITGALFFAKKLGVELPDWIFSWGMFFVTLGIYTGAKHNFRNPGFLILVAIGSALLIERIYPGMSISEFFWPGLLIVIGGFLIFKPYRKKRFLEGENYTTQYQNYDSSCMQATETNENLVNITAIMGGVKKIVLSKDFKGGEINCVMGGAEVNFTQADIHGKASIEINNILGGTKLIVPANWEVISDAMVIMGGVEDKRPLMPDAQRAVEKTLYIKGVCVFGGIDIKSY